MSPVRKKPKKGKQDELFESKTADSPPIPMPQDKAVQLVEKKEHVLEEFIIELKDNLKRKDGELGYLRSEKETISKAYAEFREEIGKENTSLKKDVRHLKQGLLQTRIYDLLSVVCLTITGGLFGFWLNDTKEKLYLLFALLFLLIGAIIYIVPLFLKEDRRGDRS